jgi:formate hydrogenlyase subunit 6/NADH:ubiquinone oxidoreductase subunit I
MSFFKVNDKCNGCLACLQNCPASALDYVDQGNKRSLLHNMARCARCGNCWRICPTQAIEFQHLLDGKWEEVTSLNLVRCMICGDPLYTVNLGEALGEKLAHDGVALCPWHRKALSLSTWKRIMPGRNKNEEVKP